MADDILHVKRDFFAPDATDLDLKLHDNGDGTYSIVAHVEGSPAGSSPAASTVISPTSGTKSVTTSGTAVALAASTKVFSFLIQPKTGNTGNIFFGSSAVHKTTSPQLVLPAGAPPVTVTAPVGYVLDLSQWFIDASVSSEGVDFVYIS
jgi:hypothetical protein